jgi:hypothetical protein
MEQLALWLEEDQTLPLPLLIARRHEFALQTQVSERDEVLYAVQDWIAGVAQAAEPRKFRDQLNRRLARAQLSIVCRQLPYRARNGKVYQMDYTDASGLYRLTQHMDSSGGICGQVLEYLARSGALVDEMRTDPEEAALKLTQRARERGQGRDSAWQEARESGRAARKSFMTAALRLAPGVHPGALTNDVYRGVTGMTAAQLRAALGIGVRGNPRDHLSRLALLYTAIAEEAAGLALQRFGPGDVVPGDTVRELVQHIADATGQQAQTLASLAGIDLLTGTLQLNAPDTSGAGE